MSKTFLITYDLNSPGKDYSALYEAIKGLGSWHHPLESTWAVKPSLYNNSQDIYNVLRPIIDDTDDIFIVDITNQDRQGWMPKTFWEWLKG